MRLRLADLSANHIFQWSTLYRDLVREIFDYALPVVQKAPDDDRSLVNRLEDDFANHATEIFSKGYEFKIKQGVSHDQAVVISVYGLQRFLDLPLELYANTLANTTEAAVSRAARQVCSALLAGILQGYGHVRLAGEQGWHLLPRYRRSWAHCLAFFCAGHLDQLASPMEAGEFRTGLQDVLLPVLKAIDQLDRVAPGGACPLPGLGQFIRDAWRLEIALELPHPVGGRRYLDLHCYLSHAELRRDHLEESVKRLAVLIAASPRSDLKEHIDRHEQLRPIFVDASAGPGGAKDQALKVLTQELARLNGPGTWSAPLTHNLARDFPLENPYLQKHFRVHRPSILALLRNIERKNGIHLWCSVRRSGKTTAVFGLSSSTASAVVTQTCEYTGQDPDTGQSLEAGQAPVANTFIRHFNDAFDAALSRRARLPDTFFRDVVARCAGVRTDSGKKIIFMLDEYETLFRQLREAVQVDPLARDRFVQPLLNQMVAFARENLLLLIGMQPDAHYILLDQNQFSANVQQHEFPLFDHRPGAATSEFVLLLQLVLRKDVRADQGFTDALYAETGGHPYLTVKLLVEFFDWLIAEKQPAFGQTLVTEDFRQFAAARLTPEAIRRSKEYTLFHELSESWLDRRQRREHPWLYAVFGALRLLAADSPEEMVCSVRRFRELVAAGRFEGRYADPDVLLRTAAPANFLAIQGEEVRPRIPLLARIALATRPPVRP